MSPYYPVEGQFFLGQKWSEGARNRETLRSKVSRHCLVFVRTSWIKVMSTKGIVLVFRKALCLESVEILTMRCDVASFFPSACVAPAYA